MLTPMILERYAEECETIEMNIAKEVTRDVLSRRFKMEHCIARKNVRPYRRKQEWE